MRPAKSIAAGVAIAAVTLAVAYADRPAFLDHWFYKELVGWQTGLGALFGLLGLAAVAAWNFKKTRDRDKELRDEEARAVATVICREMSFIRVASAAMRVWIDGLGAMPGRLDVTYEMVKFPIVNVYEKLVSNLGILPPDLVDGIVTVYGDVLNTQQAIARFINRDDLSQEEKDYLRDRVARLSVAIEPVAVKLAAFAEFETPDDVFRSTDDAIAAIYARADANTAAEEVAADADPPDPSDYPRRRPAGVRFGERRAFPHAPIHSRGRHDFFHRHSSQKRARNAVRAARGHATGSRRGASRPRRRRPRA